MWIRYDPVQCNNFLFQANATPQDLSQVTTAPKIKKEWSDIDFEDMESWQVEQLHRAIGEQVNKEDIGKEYMDQLMRRS